MKIELSRSLSKTLKSRIEKYNFEVGIINDEAHKDVVLKGKANLATYSNYAGGPVRKAGSSSSTTVGEVFKANQERLGIDLLKRPFQDTNSDIIKFTQAFLQLCFNKPGMTIKRVENLIQAIVRNPILKQEYGQNKASTADAKGFNRNMFDTGQMFKAIRAKVLRKGPR